MSPRKNELSDFAEYPDQLAHRGFTRSDQATTDPCRRVWFSKAIDSDTSQVRFVLRIEFELYITDDWRASYDENRSYTFNRVHLDVYDRQMDAIDNMFYDIETEHPCRLATVPLRLRTLREVESLLKLLAIDEPPLF